MKKRLGNLLLVSFFLILTCFATASAETYTSVSLYNHELSYGTANWGNGRDTFGELYANIFFPVHNDSIRQKLCNSGSLSRIDSESSKRDTFGKFYTNILYTSHDNRIRQAGHIEYITFNCENTSQLSEYYIGIWRKNCSSYTLVYMSKNLVPYMKNGSNTIWLNDSTFIREGDYVGESIKDSGISGYAYYAPSYGTFQYFYKQDKLDIYYTRDSVDFIPSLLMMTHPIEIYMRSPDVVFIGDSIFAGHPGHYSFLETGFITNLNSSCEVHFGKFSGLTYQNMGIGGQTTSHIRERFQNDVINQYPKYVVLEGGVNDVMVGTSDKIILENWEFMLSECVNNSIQPVVVLILPWTNGDAAQTAQVNYINKQLTILSSKYNATIVDARDELGIYNKETDKWSIKPEYDTDGVHLNILGYIILGQKIADTI